MTAKPENVTAEVWADWVKHRKEKRQPLTETTCRHQAKQLSGHLTPDAVIIQSITCGWVGLFPDKTNGSKSVTRKVNTDSREYFEQKTYRSSPNWQGNENGKLE